MQKKERIEIKKSNEIFTPYTGPINQGAEIVVQPGCCAIYLKDGEYEVFSSGVDSIEEEKRGFFGRLRKKEFSAGGEIIGVNMEMVQEIKYGAGDINVIEKLTGKPMTFGVSGTYKIQIGNPLMLATRLVGNTTSFTADDLRAKLKNEVITYVKKVFGAILSAFGRYELDSAIGEICENLKVILYPKFEFYGVKLVDFTVVNFTDIDPELTALIDQTATTKYAHGELREVLNAIRTEKLDENNFAIKLAEAMATKNNTNGGYFRR